jgi:hypothetical protein
MSTKEDAGIREGATRQGAQGVDTVHAYAYQWPPHSGRRRVMRAIGLVVVAAAVIVQLVACQRGSNATLKERASKYWQLKQQKRWEEVYDGYLDPALKGALDKDAFLKKRLLAFDLVDFTIADSDENGDQGTVHVKADANLPLRGIGGKVQMRRQEITSEDTWVKRDGTWYIRLSE